MKPIDAVELKRQINDLIREYEDYDESDRYMMLLRKGQISALMQAEAISPLCGCRNKGDYHHECQSEQGHLRY